MSGTAPTNIESDPDHNKTTADKPWLDQDGMYCELCHHHRKQLHELEKSDRSGFVSRLLSLLPRPYQGTLGQRTIHLVSAKLVVLMQGEDRKSFEPVLWHLRKALPGSCSSDTPCAAFKPWYPRFYFKAKGCTMNKQESKVLFKLEMTKQLENGLVIEFVDPTTGKMKQFDIARKPTGSKKAINAAVLKSIRGDGCVIYVSNRDLAAQFLGNGMVVRSVSHSIEPWAPSHEHMFCYRCQRLPGEDHEFGECPAPKCQHCGAKDHERDDPRCHYNDKAPSCHACFPW
jgi:hypothetical protein